MRCWSINIIIIFLKQIFQIRKGQIWITLYEVQGNVARSTTILKGLNKKDTSTYTQILYQLVFSTCNHEITIHRKGQESLYKYRSGILKNKKCHLYQIGGIEDHIHIVTHVHPSIGSASFLSKKKIFNFVMSRRYSISVETLTTLSI